MIQGNDAEVLKALKREEGFRSRVYHDTLGNLTIGYGTNLDVGISELEALALLVLRADAAKLWLEKRYGWFKDLTDDRQRALLLMVYQLGPGGFVQFQKMIAALRLGKWDKAAAEALDSRWARQTPRRAGHVAKLLRGD